MIYRIGDKIKDIWDGESGTIARIEIIAGLKTYYVLKSNGEEIALYEDELQK